MRKSFRSFSIRSDIIHGDDLKADLKKLDARYSALSATKLQRGLMGFAAYPRMKRTFWSTAMDKYLPGWREKITYNGARQSGVPEKDARHGEQP